ncbi:MAG: hypothetical protein AAGB12_15805 [Pseudomonadota bacterium]
MFALVMLGIFISGFYYGSQCHSTKLGFSRLAGHRLYFTIARYGIQFFLSATLLIAVMSREVWNELQHILVFYTKGAFKLSAADVYACVSVILTLCLCWIYTFLKNVFTKDIKRYKSVQKEASFLERVFIKAIKEYKPICLSMENSKVYVGFVIHRDNPLEDHIGESFVAILPLISGYRDPEDQRIKFTTGYSFIYDQLDSNSAFESVKKEDFIVVLPINKINSVNLFDMNAYNAFSAKK